VGPGYSKLQEQLLTAGPFDLPAGVDPPGFVVDDGSSTGSSAGSSAGSSSGLADGSSTAGAGSSSSAGMMIVLRRAAPGEVAAAAAASERQLAAGLDSTAGFSLVLEAMRDSRKPAVAHNLRFDLAFLLQQCVGPLPAGWADYKKMIGGWLAAVGGWWRLVVVVGGWRLVGG
jgi:hypothetical protein